MKTLEACYEIDFSAVEFLERKQKITHPKTLLLGPPKCGKSFLIYDYLSNFEPQEYLYIDFGDFKNNKDDIIENIDDFIKDNGITVLVLENHTFDFKIPQCQSIIITTTKPKELFGFKLQKLMPLDFEEFLLHDNHHQNATNAFNHFLKYGNLPEIVHFPEFLKNKRLQEIVALYTKDRISLEILKLLFTVIDEKKSLHQLFTLLKKTHKISKDKFYEMCKVYEQNQLLFSFKNMNNPKQ
jgi:predicted AAA+ superfamily ATPase